MPQLLLNHFSSGLYFLVLTSVQQEKVVGVGASPWIPWGLTGRPWGGEITPGNLAIAGQRWGWWWRSGGRPTPTLSGRTSWPALPGQTDNLLAMSGFVWKKITLLFLFTAVWTSGPHWEIRLTRQARTIGRYYQCPSYHGLKHNILLKPLHSMVLRGNENNIVHPPSLHLPLSESNKSFLSTLFKVRNRLQTCCIICILALSSQ